ncbi:MAG: hypothetical protein H7Z43_01005, partial [Clostridia bacterium]|nr:hypothetical protein [Deltaproteobacteria bacterium]
MTSYLQAGWFTRGTEPKGLRTEVIDGAMDAAGILLRAGIDSATVLRLALRTRGLISIADPRMLGMPHFGDRERAQLMNGLSRHADAAPELFAFVADCIDRVDNLTDLMAFYLHLTHVARMIELLSVAVRTAPTLGLGLGLYGGGFEATAQKPAAEKAVTKKQVATKAVAKSAASKKTIAKKAVAKKAAPKKTLKKPAVKKPIAPKASVKAKTARKKPSLKTPA